MTKRGIWPVRAMYMLVAFALVISLVITAAPPAAQAAPGGHVKAEWDMVATPSMEGWVLAPCSEILDFCTSHHGQVAYSVVHAPMTCDDPVERWHPWYLLKSTDHAATWRDITSGVKKEIDRKNFDGMTQMGHVACAPNDPDFVAVTVWPIGSTGMHVFISKDGGTTFRDSGVVEHAGVRLTQVFAFVVSPEVGGERELAIGGIGSDGLGAIFRSKAIGDWSTGWEDARYQGWDGTDPVVPESEAVFDIKFAPSWAADRTILAVTGTPSPGGFDVHLQSGTWGTTEGWNAKSTLGIEPVLVKGDIELAYLERWVAGITLPTDYAGRTSATRYSWVWINYRDYEADDGPAIGEIFRVANTSVISVTQQIHGRPLLTNVSYWGTIASGKAIAGLLGTGDPWKDPYGIMTEPCQGVQVYRFLEVVSMDICCPAWEPACKPPTGSLGMYAFYVREDKAYAVAMGSWECYDESAWSWSFDDGDTWNQLSLIDTHISFVSDVAVSPDCNKTMLVTVNLGPGGEFLWWHPERTDDFRYCDSVWYHAENLGHYGFNEYNGKWQRTWSGQFEGFRLSDYYGAVVPALQHLTQHLGPDNYFKRGLLRLDPDEENAETVYLFDQATNNLYYNDMQTLACWERGTAAVDNVVDMAVRNKSTVYVLDFDGDVAMSDDYGIGGWTKPEDTGLDAGFTIAVWGDEILVGGQYRDWSHSPHGIGNFTASDKGDPGLVTLAFDSYYGANDTIYAAVADFSVIPPTGEIYRRVIDEDDDWFDMRARPYAYTGLVLDNADGNPKTSATTGGVLYASYVGVHGTGVARMLKPAWDYCCDEGEWDYLTTAVRRYQGRFDDSWFLMMPHALKICGCLTANTYTKIFAIGFDPHFLDASIDAGWPYGAYDMCEGKYGTVWMFEDCYSKSGPDLRAPADGAKIPLAACLCRNVDFLIEWHRMCDACNYEIEFALDRGFTKGVARLPEVRPIPAVTPDVLVTHGFAPGGTYYWRIRSIEAENSQRIRSWWSDARSFTVDLDPKFGIGLTNPTEGATNVPRTNINFTWSKTTVPVDTYNFALSKNADLSAPVDTRTGITATGYTFTGTLDWDTPYYWRVIAIKDGAQVTYAVGTFRTRAETPEPPEPPPPPPTPSWVWVLIAIGAVLVIVVIVLIFRTRRV